MSALDRKRQKAILKGGGEGGKNRQGQVKNSSPPSVEKAGHEGSEYDAALGKGGESGDAWEERKGRGGEDPEKGLSKNTRFEEWGKDRHRRFNEESVQNGTT